MGHVLGPRFKLSSLNVRAADPYSDCSQPLHADSAAVADELGYRVSNIRMAPGSQRWRKLAQDALADPVAPHPQEELLTGRDGTVVAPVYPQRFSGKVFDWDCPRGAAMLAATALT